MSDKKIVNAALSKVADAVHDCKDIDVITDKMLHSIVAGEYKVSSPKQRDTPEKGPRDMTSKDEEGKDIK